jgi:hypothetical protein
MLEREKKPTCGMSKEKVSGFQKCKIIELHANSINNIFVPEYKVHSDIQNFNNYARFYNFNNYA